MYFPKFALVGILAVAAVVVMPFFFFRLLVFFFIVRLIARLMMGHRFRRHYAYQHYYENRAEPLEAGDMRFFARRFEREYQYNDKPGYSEKDLV